jgi:pyrroline-5-carboxylate reductase
MSDQQLAILGGGHMGRALIGGLLRSGTRAERISVGECSEAARGALARELGVSATADNARAVEGASLVVVAVKPQEAAALLTGLAPLLRARRPLLLSVIAGVRIATLESWCGAGVAVVRAMPNRPALVGAGATALYAPVSAGPAQRAAAERIARSLGEVVWVTEEDHLDLVTALSGSGPAYFFLLAEHMAAAGEKLGLAAPVARRLAAATLYGAGMLAHTGDGDVARLKAEIASPGGTTEAALASFAAADFGSTVAAQPRARRPGAAGRAMSAFFIYIIDALLSLALFVVIARLLLQLTRADFRNPLCQAVVQLTNPLIVPLRRVLPPIGKVDTASVVAVLLVAAVDVATVAVLRGGGLPEPIVWMDALLLEIAHMLLSIYLYAIILYALLSMIAPGGYSPLQSVLTSLCEPVLRPIRRIIPPLAGLDLSPLFATLIILGILSVWLR